MADDRVRDDAGDSDEPSEVHARHIVEDMVAGQGISSDPEALGPEDVAQLAGIRAPDDQGVTVDDDEVDRLGEITDTRIYEGDLEARPLGVDQPDEPEEENLELLVDNELREGETDNPDEAAEEGFAWVPPSDPPIVPNGDGDPDVAAGFGTSADDEPFDADHHATLLSGEDERTERVIEALRAHATTAGLVDRLEVDTDGGTVFVSGNVDDLDDEDEVLSVVSEVDGVANVVNRIDVLSAD